MPLPVSSCSSCLAYMLLADMLCLTHKISDRLGYGRESLKHSAMKQTWKSCSSTPRLSARTNTRLAPRNENAVLCIDRVVKLSGHRFKIVVVFYTRSPRTAPSQSPSHPQVKIANKLRGRPLGCATCTKALARPRAWNRIVRLR